MTPSWRMSKAWKPVLRKQAVTQKMPKQACQMGAKSVKQNHGWQKVAMSCYPTPESRKWLMAAQRGPRPSAKTNKGDSHPMGICIATPRESILQASVFLPSQQWVYLLSTKLFHDQENVLPKCTSYQNTKIFLNRTGTNATGEMAW